MGSLRGWEWLIILLIVLLLFGARRLPDLARSVGSSLKIFRREVTDKDAPPPADTPAESPTDHAARDDDPTP